MEQNTVFFDKEQQDRGPYVCNHEVDEGEATVVDCVEKVRAEDE
jgi:hypothetical protein